MTTPERTKASFFPFHFIESSHVCRCRPFPSLPQFPHPVTISPGPSITYVPMFWGIQNLRSGP